MWGVSSNTNSVGLLSFISIMIGQMGENVRRSRRQGQGIRTTVAPKMSEAEFQAAVLSAKKLKKLAAVVAKSQRDLAEAEEIERARLLNSPARGLGLVPPLPSAPLAAEAPSAPVNTWATLPGRAVAALASAVRPPRGTTASTAPLTPARSTMGATGKLLSQLGDLNPDAPDASDGSSSSSSSDSEQEDEDASVASNANRDAVEAGFPQPRFSEPHFQAPVVSAPPSMSKEAKRREELTKQIFRGLNSIYLVPRVPRSGESPFDSFGYSFTAMAEAACAAASSKLVESPGVLEGRFGGAYSSVIRDSEGSNTGPQRSWRTKMVASYDPDPSSPGVIRFARELRPQEIAPSHLLGFKQCLSQHEREAEAAILDPSGPFYGHATLPAEVRLVAAAVERDVRPFLPQGDCQFPPTNNNNWVVASAVLGHDFRTGMSMAILQSLNAVANGEPVEFHKRFMAIWPARLRETLELVKEQKSNIRVDSEEFAACLKLLGTACGASVSHSGFPPGTCPVCSKGGGERKIASAACKAAALAAGKSVPDFAKTPEGQALQMPEVCVERYDVLMWLRDHQAFVPVLGVERRS